MKPEEREGTSAVNKIKIEYSDIAVTFGDCTVSLNHAGHAEPYHAWNVLPHSHTLFELHCISMGRGFLVTPSQRCEMLPGTVCLTGPGVRHGQTSDAADGMDEYCLRFSIERRPQSAPDREEKRLIEAIISSPFFFTRQDRDDSDCLWKLAEEIITETCAGRTGFRMKVRCMFCDLLIRLGRLCLGETTGEVIYPTKLEIGEIDFRPRIDTYLLFYNNPPSVEQITSELHITRRHFSRLMQQYYSMTYFQKINRLRAEYAGQLLTESDRPIGEIALLVGFRTASHFSRIFRGITGMTPAEYRKHKG